jgi:hypothetical protein
MLRGNSNALVLSLSLCCIPLAAGLHVRVPVRHTRRSGSPRLLLPELLQIGAAGAAFKVADDLSDGNLAASLDEALEVAPRPDAPRPVAPPAAPPSLYMKLQRSARQYLAFEDRVLRSPQAVPAACAVLATCWLATALPGSVAPSLELPPALRLRPGGPAASSAASAATSAATSIVSAMRRASSAASSLAGQAAAAASGATAKTAATAASAAAAAGQSAAAEGWTAAVAAARGAGQSVGAGMGAGLSTGLSRARPLLASAALWLRSLVLLFASLLQVTTSNHRV